MYHISLRHCSSHQELLRLSRVQGQAANLPSHHLSAPWLPTQVPKWWARSENLTHINLKWHLLESSSYPEASGTAIGADPADSHLLSQHWLTLYLWVGETYLQCWLKILWMPFKLPEFLKSGSAPGPALQSLNLNSLHLQMKWIQLLAFHE